MGAAVVSGATCMCAMGSTPCQFRPSSQMTVTAGGLPMATIMDFAPNVNINGDGFGLCVSLANPQVAAATAAALGVLTPQKCMFAPAGPWIASNPSVMVGGLPALGNDATLTCALGLGQITIVNPGQTKTIV